MTPFALRILSWMEGYLDSETGLLGYPGERGSGSSRYEQKGVPIVRETGLLAIGLLARDGPGDRSMAARSLAAVLDHQIVRPGSVVHGTFSRSPIEPVPGDTPREWIDYDPNWREFIGTTLAVILEDFEDRLPAALVTRIEAALRCAVEGTRQRGVPAAYTNIALMTAFLLDWTGERFGESRWRDEAEALAREVRDGYMRIGAFPEHNSPTYYGIDLYGLALWRARAPGDALRGWGAELEEALWRDLVRFYHPGLANLCGPYTRAYGMDMLRYVASIGLWIALAEPEQTPPLPALGRAVDHAHDFCFAPLFDLLGARPPSDVRESLIRFEGARDIVQVIAGEPLRRATAWLDERVMLGGEYTSGRFVNWQHYPATIHWLLPEGGTGWLRLKANAPVDVVASEGKLEIVVHCGAKILRGAEVRVFFEIDAMGAEARIDCRESVWDLTGLRLEWIIDAEWGPPQPGTEEGGPSRVGWTFDAGRAPSSFNVVVAVNTLEA
jgi:hypothetical protein